MPKLLLVQDAMVKNLVTVPDSATVRQTAEIMHQGRFSGLPVVNEAGALVGVISEKDIFRALYPSYGEFYALEEIPAKSPEQMQDWLKEQGDKLIKDFMKEPITTTPETPLVKIGAVMMARNIHRLPVVDNGKLVGMISRRVIYRAIFNTVFGFEEAGI